jgi:hypothetical protein
MEFHKFQRAATPEQKLLFKQYLNDRNYPAIQELLSQVLGTELDDSFYKGKRMGESVNRYLIKPLGLSYDDLQQAAIVATRRENRGNIVIDQTSDKEYSRQELLRIIKRPTQKLTATPKQTTLF